MTIFKLQNTLCLITLLLASAVGRVDSAESTKPNVVMILTDDQGSVDANCYGASDLVTPALDRLAGEGVRFTQFYAAAPVCSPSRAGFLTGRVPQRAGVPGNVPSEKGKPGMPGEQVTIAEMFRKAGYRTAHIGKWHLGYTPETMPNAQGFDESFGHMGGCIDNWSHFFYWNGPNRHDLWHNGVEVWRDGIFFPDLMVEQTKQFVSDDRSKPFFIYWPINVPHYPLQGSEEWRERYSHLKHPRDKYAAFVSTMDEKIGELLAYLDEKGLRENTMVVFQSDHGHSTESRTFGGGGNAGPYRGAKFSLFEGGLRVPAIISWPGQLPQNEVRHQMATGCDWYPTLLELCNLSLPKHRLDGKSIVEVVKSSVASSPHETFHWQSGDQWAVRRGDWKLLAYPRDTTVSSHGQPRKDRPQRFLVDLAKDVGEKQNLADQHPEVVQEMESLHDRWASDLGD